MNPLSLLGLLGPVLFFIAYIRVSFGHWHARMLRFHLLNFVGAVVILLSLTVQWNLAAFLLESAWMAISVVGMVRSLKTNV